MPNETYATIGGKPLYHPGDLYRYAIANHSPIDFWQRANSYTCPRGEQPGEAWFLMLFQDQDILSTELPHELKWVEGKRNLSIPALYKDRDWLVNRALPKTEDGMYLVRFVDKREFFKFSSVNKQFNVRIPAPSTTSGNGLYYTDSLNAGSAWTWQTMLDELWSQLPSGASPGTAPTLQVTPDEPPTDFRFIGVSAWKAINSVLDRADHVVVYDPIKDEFSYVSRTAEQAGLDSSLEKISDRRVYDFGPQQAVPPVVPETIRFFFHRQELYHGIEKDTTDSDNWEMSPVVSKDYATSGVASLSGTVMTVWDDLPAEFDSAGTNTNSAALQARADSRGASILARLEEEYTRRRKLYCGLVTDIIPGSQVSEVRWRDYGDDGGLKTEIINWPNTEAATNERVQKRHRLGYLNEHLSPPDFSRHSYPDYPRTDQLVQVDDGASSTGADLTANGDGLYAGYVIRFAGSAYEQLEACWIRPSDLEGTSESAVTSLKQKDRMIGRLYGSETSGGTTLPLYLVRKGLVSESSMGMCQLVEITESDGTLFANCYSDETRQATDCVFRARIVTEDPDTQDLCDRTDVTDGADIWLKVSHNPWCEDMQKMLIGQRFLARKVADSYTIGENDFPFYTTAMEDSRLWSVTPSADWTGAKTGTIFTVDTVDTTALSPTIQDYWGLWSNVINDGNNNGFGLLIGDDFIPVAMNRKATRFKAAVSVAHLTAETSTQITTVGTVISEPPFTSDPGISAVNNTRRLAAPSGTTCWFEADAQSATDYELVDVARSDPMLIEVKGSPDGDGEPAQLTGTTSLCVWDARLVTPNASSGGLCSGGGTVVSEEDVWFGFIGPTSATPPYFLTAGQKALAYDTAKDFTPTGLAERRLYLAPQDSETYYGEALENWTDGGSSDDWVDVYPYSPQDDVTATDQAHRVYLLKNAERDPNLVTGDVVAYRLGMDGRWVAVSDYLDDKIGTVKMWALASGSIPPGWAIMNGSANATGSGIDMTNRFVKGSATAGQRGGNRFHTHPLYVIVEAHGATEIEAAIGGHRHAISDITIDDHEVADLKHEHTIGLDTISKGWPLDYEMWTPDQAARLGCTGPPLDNDGDCLGADWGPLEHTVSSGNYTEESDPSYANWGTMVHVASNSYMEPAEHEPENVTLIFIERIDNST